MSMMPGYQLSTRNLGDTIHMWAVQEAIARHRLQKDPKALSPTMHVVGELAPLFFGSRLNLVKHSSTIIRFRGTMPWVGPQHGEHVRDTFRRLLEVPSLPVKMTLDVRPFPSETPYVVVCPLGKGLHKQWPRERWLEVIEHLRKDYRVFVNDLGFMDDHERPKDVLLCYPDPPHLARLLCGAAAVVGVDSGHLHLADALCNAPVGLYGGTSVKTYGPYLDNSYCIDTHRETWHARYPYHSGAHSDHGMAAITTDRVIEAIQRRLSKRV